MFGACWMSHILVRPPNKSNEKSVGSEAAPSGGLSQERKKEQ